MERWCWGAARGMGMGMGVGAGAGRQVVGLAAISDWGN